MSRIELKSPYYYTFMVKYPSLRWIIITSNYLLFVLGTLAIVVGVIGTYMADSNMVWIPLLMLLAIIGIPYSHVRNGNIGTQKIELEEDNLTVKNSLLFFKYSRRYSLTNLQLEEVRIWNVFTGDAIESREKYARLIINDNVRLNNLFLREDLKRLIDEYKTGANTGYTQ